MIMEIALPSRGEDAIVIGIEQSRKELMEELLLAAMSDSGEYARRSKSRFAAYFALVSMSALLASSFRE